MAKGVRLKGAGGLDEFRQRRMYSGVVVVVGEGEREEGELMEMSGWRCPTPVPT